MRTATRARVSLALVLAVLRLGACSSPEDLAAASAARGAGSTVGRCVDGVNATGGACVPGALDPFGTPAPTLAWLLDAASSATARVPREDWRDGLGFAERDPPASDAEVAALLALDDAAFAAVPARERRRAVTASARHAWRGYREHAWPSDELAPVAKKGVAWLDVGLTIVDALDTLLILGLEDEAGEARDWIASPALAFDADKNANVFESTIRVLGGLAAARELGGDTERGDLLAKALDLAEKLSPAFKTRTGIPIMDVNFKTGDPHHPKWTQKSSLAEAGTLVLEWEALEAALRAAENKTAGVGEDADASLEAEMEYGFCPDGGGLKEYPIASSRDEPSCDADETNIYRKKTFARSTLAALAGRRYRRDIADGARRAFHAVTDATWHPANDGLVPNAVSSGTAKFDRASTLTLGARGDSYYEYLLKHWLHAGKPAGGERSYLRAMDGVLLYLLRRSGEEDAAAAVKNADAPGAANALGLRWGVTEPAPRATSSAHRRRRRWFEAEAEDLLGPRSDAEEKDEPRSDAEGVPAEDVEEAASAGRGVSTVSTVSTVAETTAETTTSVPKRTVPNAIESDDKNKSHGLLYVAERVGGVGGTLVHKMDHLVCFLPGVLALGHAEGLGARWGAGDAARERLAGDALERLGFARDAGHLDVAVELARTCVSMYTRVPAGLAPEIAHFPASGLRAGGAGEERVHAFGDLLVKRKDAHNLLRPETVESLFVLWRVTRAEEWRDAGWEMWRAWERHARVDSGGYAGVDSVVDPDLKSSSVLSDSGRDVHPDASSKLDATRRRSSQSARVRRELNRVDKMESFWLSETLKYLFLLFTDDPTVTPLECFVFNTEAHPLPVLRAGVSDARACVERVAARHVRSLAAMQGVETEGRSFA